MLGVVSLLVTLWARDTSANQPCRPFIEKFDLTLQEVTVDGVPATAPSGAWGVDGGAQVHVDYQVVLWSGDTAPVRCSSMTTRTVLLDLADPLTGDFHFVTLEASP